MFVEIENYPKYFVSSDGIVASIKYNEWRDLKFTLTSDGYQRVPLCKNGKCRHFLVHTLVAEAFIGPKPPGYQVNHKDGNVKNNNYTNLEYCTPKENIRHAIETGLWDPGKAARRKVSCSNGKSYNSMKAAAIDTGVAHSTVYLICIGSRGPIRGLNFWHI